MLRLGVKSHWRDAPAMAAVAREAGATLLEVHLAPRDLALDRGSVLDAFRPLAQEFALVVHQPEWVEPAGGNPDQAFFVNPASRADAWRRMSEDALVAAAALALELRAEGLVVHPGAVELPGKPRLASADALRTTLAAVRAEVGAVPTWLENMPWFYGYRDGIVGRPAIGARPEDLTPFRDVVDGWCLDLCHAFLSAPPPGGGWPAVARALDVLGPDVRHVHASGAVALPEDDPAPQAGEGVPFGEGAMGAADYARALARLPEGVAVVPEIANGFAAGGAGFRAGLAWLRKVGGGLFG